MDKFDVLVCPDCGLVLAQATQDIPPGTLNWGKRMRPVELKELPQVGTLPEDIRCPTCGCLWFDRFQRRMSDVERTARAC